MAEEDLSPGLGETVRALAGERGACPSGDDLAEYHALGAEARSGHPIDGHVQICSRCQLVLLHLDEPAAAVRTFRWQWAAAAALLLLAAGPLVYRTMKPVQEADTIRGTELQPIAPAGRVAEAAVFEWQSPMQAARYRVTVYRGTDRVWTATSGTTRLQAALPIPIEAGVEYRWVVEALDAAGDVRMTSPPQTFIVNRRP